MSRPAAKVNSPTNHTVANHQRTYEQLYEKAKRHNIQGRSKMSKTELERALGGR
jgi:hypothetical protein